VRGASRIAVVTIVARNYLALAASLLASIADFEQDIDRFVFITDASGEREDFAAGSVLIPADIFTRGTYATLARGYDILELATAVKPAVLRHLLGRQYDRVLYFDPDIQVFAALDPLIDPLDGNDIVLTPHATEPIPLDKKFPTELDLLRRGTYNLGFIGVANTPAANAMLDWWFERLEHYCVDDVPFGLFVDQKWIDLVPALFGRTAIVRHRGCNVAYWNLHTRKLDPSDQTRLITGEPVIFFHFSGFDARRPDRLAADQTRVDVAAEPALQRVLAAYARRVIERGHLEQLTLPYGHARFSLRRTIRILRRRLYQLARGLRHPLGAQ
jgi:hypothetical protein